MKLIKAIVRIIFKAIDNIIDFINYIFNIKLSKLPKFADDKLDEIDKMKMQMIDNKY